ncbi:LysR family transcriptional regulator [Halomonas sp. THAF12]|uniref:LysR family transcriptional regulator n=1 Tax=Halomonas sp. B23F22_10 TaxID=3459515 RepID=UPI00373F9BA1
MPDRLNNIDIGLLTAFEALLLTRNVSRAAERLGITQPALSSRLTRLRALFGDQLFVPVAGRGMTPTPRAEELGAMLPSLLDHLRDFVGPPPSFDPIASDRVFVVAAHDNPAAILGPDLVPALKKVAPNIRVAFVLPDADSLAPSLEHGEIDMFVGVPRTEDEGLIGRMLLSDSFLTAQRRGHPRGSHAITMEEFCAADHLLISAEGGEFKGQVDRVLDELGHERRVNVSIQSYALAPTILANSDNLCTLPSRFLRRFDAMLDLFPPPLDVGRFQLQAMWHPRMKDDPAHRWFRKQVFATAQAQ